MHCHTRCLQPCSRPPSKHASTGDSWTLVGKSGSVSCGDAAPFSWVLVHKFLSVPSKRHKHGPPEKGMANHFSNPCLENPMNSMKRQKDRTLKDELPSSVDAQYAISGEITPERMKGWSQKKKQQPAVEVMGNRSKVQCY